MTFTRKIGCCVGTAAILISTAIATEAAVEIPAEYCIGGFAVGCQAYMFHRFTAFEAIEKTAQAGAKTIEFYPGQILSKEHPEIKLDQNVSDSTIAALKAKLKEHHLMAVNFGVVDIPKDEPGARKVFEFGKKLGVRAITTEPVREQMDLLEKLVKEYDILLAIHNHPKHAEDPSYQCWNPEHVLSLVKGRDGRLGCCADTGHWVRCGLDPVASLKLLDGRIISCHIKDVTEVGNPKAGDVPLGEGVSDVRGVLRELRRQHFNGNMAIEYERDWENTVYDIAQCVGYIRGFADAETRPPVAAK